MIVVPCGSYRRPEVCSEKNNLPVEILAYHFDRSDDSRKAVQYTLLAGERTMSLYDAPAAIRFFTRTLSHSPKLEDVNETALAERTARTFLCEIFLTTGRFSDAMQEGNTALKLLPAEKARSCESARIHRLIGLVHTRQGDPLSADPWFQKALDILSQQTSSESHLERSRTYLDRTFAAYRHGDYPKAETLI